MILQPLLLEVNHHTPVYRNFIKQKDALAKYGGSCLIIPAPGSLDYRASTAQKFLSYNRAQHKLASDLHIHGVT